MILAMRRESQDEPRRASAEGTNLPYTDRMNEMLRQQQQQQQQRGVQQPPSSDGRRASMDDLVHRQQQLLRQDQYQGTAAALQDFGLPSQAQQQQSIMAAAGMPSLMEISRAEEILAAAREALTANNPNVASRASVGGGNDFADFRRDDSSRTMFGGGEGRWAASSAYNPTQLRPPGQMNAPIATIGGLGNRDLQLLLSKQNQGLSLATANTSQQQQQQQPSMRQAMVNQMPAENMGVIESLLLRQEEERLLMNKRQREEQDSSTPNKKFSTGNTFGMDPQELSTQMAAANPHKFDPSMVPKTRKRRAKTFPVKLMETLMTYYDERYVAWLPDGRSFVIIHPDEFIDAIVAKTFKNTKYASFVRKLNRWGFARLTSGTGTDCFYHPLFQRDRIDLAAQMLCMPRNDSKSTKKRKELGIEPPPAPPIVTAADMDPQDRPSLAGVDKFFPGKQQGGETEERSSSHKEDDSDATESDGDHSPDHNRKRAATTAPSPTGGRDKASV